MSNFLKQNLIAGLLLCISSGVIALDPAIKGFASGFCLALFFLCIIFILARTADYTVNDK